MGTMNFRYSYLRLQIIGCFASSPARYIFRPTILLCTFTCCLILILLYRVNASWAMKRKVTEDAFQFSDVHRSIKDQPYNLTNALSIVNAPKLMRNLRDIRPLMSFLVTPWKVTAPPHTYHESQTVRWTVVNMIKSAITNDNRRNAVRKTWGSINLLNGARIETIFIVGKKENRTVQQKIADENKKFGDILQIDLPDEYIHVPEKTLAGMQWVSENLPPHWLYSSADDDIALHPTNFIKFIDGTVAQFLSQQDAPTPSYSSVDIFSSLPIMCVYSYNIRDPPARDPKSKWFMSKDVYPPEFWPPYCRGGWYTMPVSVASELFDISRRTLYLYLDDVWITGIMRIKMLVRAKEQTVESLLEKGIIAAPLAVRSDVALFKGEGEDDLNKVIVSHVWGNIKGRDVDVPEALRELWKKWIPTVFESGMNRILVIDQQQ